MKVLIETSSDYELKKVTKILKGQHITNKIAAEGSDEQGN